MKQIREACGMTTEEFSVKLGVSRSSIEHIESGRNQPNVVYVKKLHQHFPQYSLEYILYGESSDIYEVEKNGEETKGEMNDSIKEEYKLPETCLFTKHFPEEQAITETEVNETKKRIADVLKYFNIEFNSINPTVGPSYTLYEITLAQGVRMGKVRCLEDDIALSIASVGVRVIAPIPGKGTLGIEIPHIRSCTIPLRFVGESTDFQDTNMALPIALGMGVDGKPILMNLAKAPHILIGGATGQGKSNLIHTLIASLLLKKKPDELKLVIIDSKRPEYGVYEPLRNHFLTGLPGKSERVITDTDKAVQMLECLCEEMDIRYDLLKKSGSRNIMEYNTKFEKGELESEEGHRFLPYIVLVVDDFGDLMLSGGKDVELPLCRIAQLARAVGIHAVIATQRPTRNIITDTIKANFPARVAFRVAATMDSRTILDRSGAQQLAGPGDMLVLHGRIETKRFQAVFTDRQDMVNIVQHISVQHSHTSTYPLPETKIKGSPHTDMDIRQAIDGLKRSIERLESWLDDMNDEDFHFPNE